MLSFAQAVLTSKRPFVLLHTWTVTRDLLDRAIRGNRSMDLDVCVDEEGKPYLGHTKEYHDKTREPFFDSMPLEDAVKALAPSNIPVIVDCKHFAAWPVVENVVQRLRPERCLVHSFVSELRFEAGRDIGKPDFLCEWSSIEMLRALKNKFPSLTTTASAKWLPPDALVTGEHDALLAEIAKVLTEHQVDTVCLNVPDVTFSDHALRLFLQHGILCHVGIDRIDQARLSEMYIGETGRLECATQAS